MLEVKNIDLYYGAAQALRAISLNSASSNATSGGLPAPSLKRACHLPPV